jgi:hypothetical protein
MKKKMGRRGVNPLNPTQVPRFDPATSVCRFPPTRDTPALLKHLDSRPSTPSGTFLGKLSRSAVSV